MKPLTFFSIVLSAFLAACSNSSLMNDVELRKVKPINDITLIRDSTFHLECADTLRCADIQILNDSLLVIQNHVCEESPYFFYVWSLNDSHCLGAFAQKGRGPGEYFSPHISRSPTWERFLCFTDNGTCKAYIIDPLESFPQGATSLNNEIDLSGADVSWLPIQCNKQFVATIDGEKLGFKFIDNRGDCSCRISIFEKINFPNNATTLSNMICATGKEGIVAEALLFFPHIIFIDTSTGLVRAYATHRDYRNWKTIINSPINMGSIQYYAGLTSSKEYVFATYWGMPLGKILNGNWNSTIHVFDNMGKFVYEIHVSEKIGDITVDSEAKYLYGIDLTDDSVVRYDLESIRG